MSEIWRTIPGLEGRYEASSSGRVRSLRFVNGKVNGPRPTPLVLAVCAGDGARRYLGVVLSVGNRRRTVLVHRLVALSFFGAPPVGMQVAHLDGNSRNNFPINLAYVSAAENARHRDIHGRTARGERNGGGTKLTDDAVRAIRRLHASGVPQRRLAREFGVGTSTINRVVLQTHWRHVR